VDGYSGDAGNAIADAYSLPWMAQLNNFTTVDSDNDQSAQSNCASHRGGGWWYGSCSVSYLNSITNVCWSIGSNEDVQDVATSRMLVKIN